MTLSKLDLSKLRPKLKPQNSSSLLFWGTPDDKPFLPHLKSCMGGVNPFVRIDTVHTLSQVVTNAYAKGATSVITTSVPILKKLLNWKETAAPSLANYAGSMFVHQDIEFVFIPPIRHLATVPYGKFLAKRYISKVARPENWAKATEFSWELLQNNNVEEIFSLYHKAFAIAVDIETFKTNAVIRCISYTALIAVGDKITSHTCVLPLDSEWALAWMRKFNWELKAGKIFANGKYDIAYCSRYNAPIYNYLWDVQNLFHSWYSELPKDLGFLNAFFIRKAMYWKDLAKTNDLMEYYRYNALDTWGTANAFILMMMEAPQWAIENYYQEFPLTFPAHLCEMRGIKRDEARLVKAEAEQNVIIDKNRASLDKILGVEDFNVKSPKQMKQLFKIIGCGDFKSTDEKHLAKARFRHPFNARIMNLVLNIRKARTLVENYLLTGEKNKDFKGRFLSALNPHGTDSGRLASKSHHFWCGDNIQKIPRGPAVKQTYVADEGFLFAEVDLEQAESRDTAYISGDKQLIINVEDSPDFHSANCSAFFGVPFEDIFDVVTQKTLNKALRDIAKRVNHGANYNMGAYVLIDTMGEENILKAKNLLELPKIWSFKEVAEYLLAAFHKVYPSIRGVYYPGVQQEIMTTNMIVSKAIHHMPDDGPKVITKDNFEYEFNKQLGSWSRWCFSNPDPKKNKHAYNSYMSHPPQSLNAMTLNKSFMEVYHKIAMNPEFNKNFKMCAQIHDSILFQYRAGHKYICDQVKELMEIPVTVKGYDGQVRTFVVPASVKAGIDGKVAKYWSETE